MLERVKVNYLCDALGVHLSEVDCHVLQSHLCQHDFLHRQVCEAEALIDEKLARYQSQLQLLETIRGISYQSACHILIETSAPSACLAVRNCSAAVLGLVLETTEAAASAVIPARRNLSNIFQCKSQ